MAAISNPILACCLAAGLATATPSVHFAGDGKDRPAGSARSDIEGKPPVREKIYEATIGVRLTSRGSSKGITACTVIPLDWPEQTVELLAEREFNGVARETKVSDGGAVLIFRSKPLRAGETAYAVREYRITVRSIPKDWKPDDFPKSRPPVDRETKLHLGTSPGIQTNDPGIARLSRDLTADKQTDLEKLQAIFDWVHREIEYREGKFTSAKSAIVNRIGDCEEKSSAFIALARAAGIPARTVWSPGHCWAEFHLVDKKGNGRWLPAHLTNPPWFGSLGSTQVILQKGDNFKPPEWRGRPKRLLSSWYTGTEPRPEVEFIQDIKPIGDDSPRRNSE